MCEIEIEKTEEHEADINEFISQIPFRHMFGVQQEHDEKSGMFIFDYENAQFRVNPIENVEYVEVYGTRSAIITRLQKLINEQFLSIELEDYNSRMAEQEIACRSRRGVGNVYHRLPDKTFIIGCVGPSVVLPINNDTGLILVHKNCKTSERCTFGDIYTVEVGFVMDKNRFIRLNQLV